MRLTLSQHATPETFPRVRSIVTQLIRPPPIAKPVEQSDAPKIATLDEPDSDSELESNDGDDEDDASGVQGARTQSHVRLARKYGKCCSELIYVGSSLTHCT